MKTHHRPALIAAIALTLLAACGSDDSDSAESSSATAAPTTAVASTEVSTTAAPVTDAPTTEAPATDASTSDAPTTAPADSGDEPAVEWTIEARDYAFDDVPDAVPVGTRFTLVNGSDREVHELVAVRLADDETRSVAELVTLPQDQLFGLIGPGPATVIVAPPDAEGFPVVGDGSLQEAGRYLLICTIPLGADPEEFLAAAQASDGPPQVAGGAPHFTAGMFAEVVVDPEL